MLGFNSLLGIGTDESDIIEIICSKNNNEVKEIAAQYEELYKRPLVEHICTEISGSFARLITLIVTGARDPPGNYLHLTNMILIKCMQ